MFVQVSVSYINEGTTELDEIKSVNYSYITNYIVKQRRILKTLQLQIIG